MKRYVFLLYILATFASANNADIDQILEENQTSISLSETSQEKVDNLSRSTTHRKDNRLRHKKKDL